MYTIAFFVIGIGGTIMHMLTTTQSSIITQAAQAFAQYGVGEYHRPAGLEVIEWAGIILQPLNYAVWLWIALQRMRRGKSALWTAFVGAVIAWILTFALVGIALSLHPELVDAILTQATATPTPR